MYKRAQQITLPVRLKSEDCKGFFECLNHFIEQAVFWRLQRFKNHPRSNFLLLRAMLIVPSFAALSVVLFAFANWLLFHLLHIALFVDPDKGTSLGSIVLQCLALKDGRVPLSNTFATYLGAVLITYWNVSSVFRQQWTHANDIYTKMLQADFPVSAEISRSLAIDLLIQDLWAHRSFRDLFATELEEAIEFHYKSSARIVIDKVNRGELSESEALFLLEKLQTKKLSTAVRKRRNIRSGKVVHLKKRKTPTDSAA